MDIILDHLEEEFLGEVSDLKHAKPNKKNCHLFISIFADLVRLMYREEDRQKDIK